MSNEATMSLRFLAEEMVRLQAQKEELEEKLKAVNARLDRVRTVEIPAQMESLGIANINFEGIGRVQLASDLYTSTREGAKEKAIEWLRDCGYDGMVTETYNASSLKALFRQMIAGGTPIPDDIFNVTPFTRASIVKR